MFKGRPSLSKKNCVICFIEGPLKMMMNAFYFILKALSKFMTSQPGEQTVEIQILTNILGSFSEVKATRQ